ALAHQRGEAIHALAKVDRAGRNQDAHRTRRDDHERPFATRSTAASHPTSTPHSARTTIPAVSIVIEGVVATGFCAAIMTGTNTAASSAGSASWPRRAAFRHAKRCRRLISSP